MPPLAEDIPPIGVIGIRGRNGSDSRFVCPDDQCLEALNIDWHQSSLGRRRGGCIEIPVTGGTAHSSGVRSAFRFVPGDDETAAELWDIDGARVFHRMAGGSVFSDPTVTDSCSAAPNEVNWVNFNGKLFVLYKNAHNRAHVVDPSESASTIRRSGFAVPAQITSVTEAAGAVTNDRKYRAAWTKQVSGATVRRSNLGTASATISLSAEDATVTRPTAPGEGETHWELYAANGPTFSDYRLVATTVIATTTAVDNQATLGSTVAPLEGANTALPSAKYGTADDARLILCGAYEAASAVTGTNSQAVPKVNRVWYTSVLGASDVGDDERVFIGGPDEINAYSDVEEAITGISSPMQLVSAQASSLERGSFYVFSAESQWKFVSTGDADAPYIRFRVTGGRGCIHHKTILTAEDANGNPAIYWLSKYGPMRITAAGQEFLGEDISDLWPTVNLDATGIVGHSIFVAEKRQVWFYVATGSSNTPNKKFCFDISLGRVTQIEGVRKGWSLHDGEACKAYCSFMFSETPGATMSRSLKPHIGYTGDTEIWKCDMDDLEDDNGNTFQAYIDSKSYVPWGLGQLGGMTEDAFLVASASPGVLIQLLIYRNEGEEELPSNADLTPMSDRANFQEKVFPKFEGSRVSETYSLRIRVGDPVARAATWNLDAVVLPVSRE